MGTNSQRMNTEQLRADFEAHFSKPPFEWEFHRYGEDSAWPGNYQLYEHQCAWEAYQAGRAALQSQDREDAVGRLIEALKSYMHFGCPVCSGDCHSANPPVSGCPVREAQQAIDHARRAEGGEGE